MRGRGQRQGKALVRDAVTIALAGARFRLAGIVPPEKQSCGDKDCAEIAAQIISSKLGGRQITCAKERRICHGYFLAQCKLDDGADLAKLILEEGLAVPEPNAPAGYVAASENAKAHGRGFWSR